MFVPKRQRSFIQFLWWEDDDLTQKAVPFEMNVHLFGATSSPSCANFALRKTANDGESEFGKNASNCMKRNFYVDDFLKSVDDPDEGITLLRNTTKLCESGGFKLTKLISNSKKYLAR